MKNKNIYYIPARFRQVENMHILLWLIKDTCWALNLKIPGMIMIIPTLTVALLITWQTRRITSEFLHNLCVVFWITANCTWMIGEFFRMDEGTWGLRNMSLIPFSIGLLILAYYYFILVPNPAFRKKMSERAEEVIEEEISKSKPA